MSRGVEPDPQTWWDDYGHRLESPVEPARPAPERDGAADLTEDSLTLPEQGWGGLLLTGSSPIGSSTPPICAAADK